VNNLEFRAWIIKENEYLMWDDMYGLERHDNGTGIHVAIADHCFLSPEEVIIEQYTGLKDKNTVKMFKNDIMKCPPNNAIDHEYNVVIKFENGRFYGERPGFVMTEDLFWLSRNAEIIGNIHESKDS